MPQEILYEFDQFQLNPLRRKLFRNGEAVPITPLASDLLSLFVKNNGRPLSKTELIRGVWSENLVTDNNFNVTLNAVRRALNESGRAPKYLLKVSGGYCFVANVREVRHSS